MPAIQEEQTGTIFVDFDISSNNSPVLIFRNLQDNSTSVKELPNQERFSWKIDNKRYCIGYHTEDEYHSYQPCPSRSAIDTGVQCNKCKHRDLLFPCMICDGSECLNVKSIWNSCEVTRTSVYIAIFGDTMKVGVSKKDRLMKRWLEQGADHASEVAIAPNGLIAREIESAVSREFEVTKGVRLQKKLKTLSSVNQTLFDNESHVDIIEKYNTRITGISRWISEKFGQGLAVENPIIRDLHDYYQFSNTRQLTQLNGSGSLNLEGSFAGMKGSLFCIERKGQFYVLDIRELRGRLSNFSTTTADYSTKETELHVPQTSISDFFG